MTALDIDPPQPAIRVVIADDHLLVREGLRAVLGLAADLELVGEAGDGLQAVQLVDDLVPDVVLMDLRMPNMDGIEAIQRIKARHPEVEIVVLTTYDDDQPIVAGLRAGARGYLLKDTGRVALFNAIRAAARGESFLPPAVLEKLLARAEQPQARAGGVLSLRERQVLALLVQGASNKEIARRLNVAERTVKAHVSGLFNKLGVNSRTEAVSLAVRTGLVPLEEQGL